MTSSHLPRAALSREILASGNPFSRTNQMGHITASGLVTQDDKVLLIFHPFIRQWFQPGGHIDEGEEPIQTSIREVFEETGVICEPLEEYLNPIDIDLHEIPENPKKGEGRHLHIDLLFLLRVVDERESPEDIQKVWLPFEKITNEQIRRTLQKLQGQI